MAGITDSERRKFIRFYVGVDRGYLNGIPDIRALEVFCINCGLEVDPRDMQGTNKDKFEAIFAQSPPQDQATIIRAMLDRIPSDASVLTTRTQTLHDELEAVASRLEGASPVPAKKPKITCASVERCIENAEQLIKKGDKGMTDAVDLHHVGFVSLLEAIKEMTVATVKLVGVPGDHFDAVGLGSIDQIQCDLGLGFELDFIGDSRFFRSVSSPAHSWGR
jgi:hypothetical protein